MPTGFTTGFSEVPRDYAKEYKVLELRSLGLTLEEIGTRLNISRERVRQIILRKENSVPHSEAYFLWKLVMTIWPPD